VSSGLNLLPNQAKFQAKKIRLQKKVNHFVWIFGGVWLGSVVVVLIIWMVFKIRLESDRKKYSLVLNQYQLLAENAVVSERLKYRAKLVSQVLESRFEYGESMQKIGSLFSSEINLDNIDLESRNLFRLTGNTRSEMGINEIEEKIQAALWGKFPGLVSMELLALSFENDVWEFEVEVKTE